jgi:hypothetical protein
LDRVGDAIFCPAATGIDREWKFECSATEFIIRLMGGINRMVRQAQNIEGAKKGVSLKACASRQKAQPARTGAGVPLSLGILDEIFRNGLMRDRTGQ